MDTASPPQIIRGYQHNPAAVVDLLKEVHNSCCGAWSQITGINYRQDARFAGQAPGNSYGLLLAGYAKIDTGLFLKFSCPIPKVSINIEV